VAGRPLGRARRELACLERGNEESHMVRLLSPLTLPSPLGDGLGEGGGLRYNDKDIAAGAQTERRGGAGQVRGLLGGKDLTGRFFSTVDGRGSGYSLFRFSLLTLAIFRSATISRR
jgi:hypothetical protein